MKIHAEIIDDNGEVISEHWGDASSPTVWNAPTGQKFVSKMPQNSYNENTGTYELFRVTFQPHVRVNRPNGYLSPVPSQPQGLPANFPKPLYSQTPKPWGTSAPTQANFSPPSLMR